MDLVRLGGLALMCLVILSLITRRITLTITDRPGPSTWRSNHGSRRGKWSPSRRPADTLRRSCWTGQPDLAAFCNAVARICGTARSWNGVGARRRIPVHVARRISASALFLRPPDPRVRTLPPWRRTVQSLLQSSGLRLPKSPSPIIDGRCRE